MLATLSVKDALAWCASHPSQLAACRDDGLWQEWFLRDWASHGRALVRPGESYRQAYERTLSSKRLRTNSAAARELGVFRVPYIWKPDLTDLQNIKMALLKYWIADEIRLDRIPTLRSSSVHDIVQFLRQEFPRLVIPPSFRSRVTVQESLDLGVEALVAKEGNNKELLLFFFLTPDHDIYVFYGHAGIPRRVHSFNQLDVTAVDTLAKAIPYL